MVFEWLNKWWSSGKRIVPEVFVEVMNRTDPGLVDAIEAVPNSPKRKKLANFLAWLDRERCKEKPSITIQKACEVLRGMLISPEEPIIEEPPNDEGNEQKNEPDLPLSRRGTVDLGLQQMNANLAGSTYDGLAKMLDGGNANQLLLHNWQQGTSPNTGYNDAMSKLLKTNYSGYGVEGCRATAKIQEAKYASVQKLSEMDKDVRCTAITENTRLNVAIVEGQRDLLLKREDTKKELIDAQKLNIKGFWDDRAAQMGKQTALGKMQLDNEKRRDELVYSDLPAKRDSDLKKQVLLRNDPMITEAYMKLHDRHYSLEVLKEKNNHEYRMKQLEYCAPSTSIAKPSQDKVEDEEQKVPIIEEEDEDANA